MNPDIPTPREEIEAKLTALLLGELPADQAFALGRTIEQDPELAKVYARLKETVGFVRETVVNSEAQASAQSTPLKLSDERREKLLAHFKTVKPKEFTQPKTESKYWVLRIAAAGVVIFLIISISVPNFVKTRTTSQSNAILNNLRQIDGAKQQWAIENHKSDNDQPTMANLEPYLKGGLTPVAGEKYQVGRVGQPDFADLNTPRGSKTITLAASEIVGLGGNRKEGIGLTPLSSQEFPNQTDKSKTLSFAGDSGVVEKPVTLAANDGKSASIGEPGRAKMNLIALPYQSSAQESLGTSSLEIVSRKDFDNHQNPQTVSTQPSGSPAANVELTGITRITSQKQLLAQIPKKIEEKNASDFSLAGQLKKDDLSGLTAGGGGGGGGAGGIRSVPAQATDEMALRRYRLEGARTTGPASVHAEPVASPMPAPVDPTTGLPLANAVAESESVSPINPATGLPIPMSSSAKSVVAASGSPEGVGRELIELPKAELQATYEGSQGGGGHFAKERIALPESKESKVPMLGDLPLSGRLFRSESDASKKADEVKQGLDLGMAANGVDRSVSPTLRGYYNDNLRRPQNMGEEMLKNVEREENRRLGFDTRTIPDSYVEGLREAVRKNPQDQLSADRLRIITEARDRRDGNRAFGFDWYLGNQLARKPLEPSTKEKTVGLPVTDLDIDSAKSKHPSSNLYSLAVVGFSNVTNASAAIPNGNLDSFTRPVLQFEAADSSADQQAAKTSSPNERSKAIAAPIPQPEIQAHESPYSTFSLNVSDVSFKLAAASLEKGQMPEPASVRSEEFINAFDYRDPEPAAGVPVAFAFERSRYPFAHNRDLLRFSIKTAAAGRQPGRPLNLVLLLDNSGSMERADRVRIIHEALRVLSGQLQAQDKLSVVTFARTPRLWVDGIAGDQAGKVTEEVSGLTPQGGTNLEEAMNLAYQTAARHYLANGINRVVLLTDGAANLGDVTPDSLKQKVETQRRQGIALDCFGIGWEGFNDDLLETLSRNGDGRYGFINTPEEAATEFAGQLAGALQVAASDVKVQVEFNPKRVTAYRQIGYAKHQLTKEQFRDNTVDAAEIGAAESGNALYVIEVNQGGEGPLGIVRVRFKVPGTNDYREHEWPVPFNGNAVSLEQGSPAMRLAATASAFSEWLVSSPYAAEVTPDRLLSYLSGVPDVYGADARPKKLEWMIRQAKSVAGK